MRACRRHHDAAANMGCEDAESCPHRGRRDDAHNATHSQSHPGAPTQEDCTVTMPVTRRHCESCWEHGFTGGWKHREGDDGGGYAHVGAYEKEAASKDASFFETHARRSGDRVRLRRRMLSSSTRHLEASSLAMLLWFYCFILGQAPTVRSVPPHLRACPGPLDGGDSRVYEFSSVFRMFSVIAAQRKI
jgi:hypothetical protein